MFKKYLTKQVENCFNKAFAWIDECRNALPLVQKVSFVLLDINCTEGKRLIAKLSTFSELKPFTNLKEI